MTAKIARPTTARIRPLPPEDRDPESKALIDSIGSSSTDNTFNTLARHPSLLRAWMPFAAGILVEGQLPARVRELAILRTGWNCRSEYEFGQHAVLARKVGFPTRTSSECKAAPMRRDGPSSSRPCFALPTNSTPTRVSPMKPGRRLPSTSTTASSSRCRCSSPEDPLDAPPQHRRQPGEQHRHDRVAGTAAPQQRSRPQPCRAYVWNRLGQTGADLARS